MWDMNYGDKTYPEFWWGIDELELDLLKITAGSVDHEGFTEGHHTLLSTRDWTLEHKEVVLDDTVVGESTHGSDRLVCSIGFGGSVVFIITTTNAINLLVEFSTVMVTVYQDWWATKLPEPKINTYFDQHEQLRTWPWKDAMHRYKRPCGDPCESYEATSWFPIGE